MIIRALLLLGIALIGHFVFLRRTRMPIHIVLLFGMLGLGAVATIFPNLSNIAAQAVGVGRGADLVSYVLDLVFLFTLLFYYTKFVELEQKVAVLVRESAILTARLEETGQKQAAKAPEG